MTTHQEDGKNVRFDQDIARTESTQEPVQKKAFAAPKLERHETLPAVTGISF